jgi:NAD-dependent histone deacetylase SIR2
MAAHPSEGPALAQHPAPPPAGAIKADPGAGGANKPRNEDAPAPEQDDDDGGAWDQASLYEEILDEVEAFEYSDDGESGLVCALHAHHC